MTRRPLLVIVGLAATAVVVATLVLLTPAGTALRRLAGDGRVTDPAGDAAEHVHGAPVPAAPLDAARSEAPPRGEIVIDPRRQQQIGVRLAPVRRATLQHEVRAVGVVRIDERRQSEITTRVDGWIRGLRADFTGRTIARGEPLFMLYSPALLTAQNEYLLTVRGHDQAGRSELANVREYAERLRAASRERLHRWDFSDADIAELERRGQAADEVVFRSPVSGTIVEKTAVEGMRVMAGQTLFRVADLSVVWVEADVPEHDMAAIRVGQTATVTLESLPGAPLTGRTAYVYPTVQESTRAARVRVELPNRDGRLRPGMFATVQFSGRAIDALTVPLDAVLDGGRDQVVFVALGEGRFEPRPVTIGRRTREEAEVTSGLREGEQVATGAAFFLDSESQLRAAIRSFDAPGAPVPQAPSGAQLDIALRVQPDPPRTGENQLEVTVRDTAGQPVSGADVTVTVFMPAMPSMNMPAMRSEARLPRAGEGVYRGTVDLPMAGRWDVTLDVSRGGQRLGSRLLALVAR